MPEASDNYTELLDALVVDPYTIIIAVVRDGKLIDWQLAKDYCTLSRARLDNDWPDDADIILVHALDALCRYFAHGIEAY